MNDFELAKRLVALAGNLLADDGDDEGEEKEASGRTRLTAKDPRTLIRTLPGMSRMQVESWLNTIVKARQEMAIESKKYEAFLLKMEELKDVETKALGTLKEASKQMRDKGKFLLEVENAMLQFTAFVGSKHPGVEQMLMRPEDAEAGAKAGDLLEKIAAKLGKKVSEAVGEIYRQTVDDLTETQDLVTAFKVLQRAESKTARERDAGITDVIIGLKDWLAGEVNAFTRRAIGFAGNAEQWARRFAERTGIVKRQRDDILAAIEEATTRIDQLVV